MAVFPYMHITSDIHLVFKRAFHFRKMQSRLILHETDDSFFHFFCGFASVSVSANQNHQPDSSTRLYTTCRHFASSVDISLSTSRQMLKKAYFGHMRRLKPSSSIKHNGYACAKRLNTCRNSGTMLQIAAVVGWKPKMQTKYSSS